ncbi:MAG: substrate-binding domain-containing protein, partial [Candidatus Korarchaeum sp.]|nr:substrate-binding domain-containing protein [Candidatus Korarchaeum sp.]
YRGFSIKFVPVGSYGGFKALARGEADVAGVHALDPETMEYNVPFLRRFSLEGKALLLKGYKRVQGLLISKGNPKGIMGLRDLLERDDIILINRNRGSGTRILLDHLLRREAESSGMSFEEVISRIKGYWSEAKSHNAVAATVKSGFADVGIGIETVARLYDLDFIPIIEESYDFLVRRSSLRKKVVEEFLEILRDPEIRRRINSLKGLKAQEDIGSPIT